MHSVHRGYVHRGDGERRRERIRRALLSIAFAAAIAILVTEHRQEANASGTSFSFGMSSQARRLRDSLDAAKGELDVVRAELDRANRVMGYSTRYEIGADLAGAIYDVALAEGLEPELAFRVVHVESRFNERALSPVGAIGLLQVMPHTAKYFQRGITREKLYDRQTNLRIGFRYLRTLIREQDGNVKLALLVYNRGPAAVNAARERGIDPANGYDRVVTKGYTGSGVID
jgi:soluble lytic murein transglycosylase-like protein